MNAYKISIRFWTLFGLIVIQFAMNSADAQPETPLLRVESAPDLEFTSEYGRLVFRDMTACREDEHTFLIVLDSLGPPLGKIGYAPESHALGGVIRLDFHISRMFAITTDCAAVFSIESEDGVNFSILQGDTATGEMANSFPFATETESVDIVSDPGSRLELNPLNNYLFFFGFELTRTGGKPGYLEIDPAAQQVVRAIALPDEIPEGLGIGRSFAIHPDSGDIFILSEFSSERPEPVLRRVSQGGELLEVFTFPPGVDPHMSEDHHAAPLFTIDPASGNFLVLANRERININHMKVSIVELAPATNSNEIWGNYE